MQLCKARRMKEGVADREGARVQRIPIAINNAGPVVGTDQIADIHVGNSVAVNLIVIPERVAERGKSSESAIQGPESPQPIAKRVLLRARTSGGLLIWAVHRRYRLRVLLIHHLRKQARQTTSFKKHSTEVVTARKAAKCVRRMAATVKE